MRRQRNKYKLPKNHAQETTALIRLSIYVSIAMVIVLSVGIFLPRDIAEPASNKKPISPPKDVNLSVVCVGDIMMHTPQIMAQYNSKEKRYKFDDNFQYVKSYIQSADLAMCNLETTFAGKPYTGYPNFCAPDTLADSLKGAGFDVAFTANNHMADKGKRGITRTLKILKEKGIAAVGSVEQPENPRYIIKNIKGVKMGFIAFTYETGSGKGKTSINGQKVSASIESRINSFNMNTMKQDRKKIKETIDEARTAGAEIIIAYYHWGEEFKKKANKDQKELASETAEMGADIIFASHPHVLQQAEYIKIAKTGKIVPVFYSMGNFISNQREESLENRYTEQGVIARVDLVYSKSKKKIIKVSMSGTPTWVDRYSSSGDYVYRIIPLDETFKKNKTLAASGHLSRAKQALEDSNEILGLN